MSAKALLPNYFAQNCFVKKLWYFEKEGTYFLCYCHKTDSTYSTKHKNMVQVLQDNKTQQNDT